MSWGRGSEQNAEIRPTTTANAARHFLVFDYDPERVPSAVRAMVPPEVLRRWGAIDRSSQSPRIIMAASSSSQECLGAALVTARPQTRYLKIVDAVGDQYAAAEVVIAYAAGKGALQVKWEGWSTGQEPETAGFRPLKPPVSGTSSQPLSGYVLMLDGDVEWEPAYYQQTTHFSCAAAAGMMTHPAQTFLEPSDINRTAELTLWRAATNFPTCEPFGLGLALHRKWPTSGVSIVLDTDAPLFVDHMNEDEQSWRIVLQRVSRFEAGKENVPVARSRLTMEALASRLRAGDQLLLLISMSDMLGFDVPHWVLCHGITHQGHFLLEDPWVATERGETWVDCHLLPVASEVLDHMSLLGKDSFRGAVVLSNGPSA